MIQNPNYNLIFFHKGNFRNFHYPSGKRTREETVREREREREELELKAKNEAVQLP
jgi:hypothetical protein